MSDALDKAKAAIFAAREMDVDLGEPDLPRAYHRLLILAETQAMIAQAAAMERMADCLDSFAANLSSEADLRDPVAQGV